MALFDEDSALATERSVALFYEETFYTSRGYVGPRGAILD